MKEPLCHRKHCVDHNILKFVSIFFFNMNVLYNIRLVYVHVLCMTLRRHIILTLRGGVKAEAVSTGWFKIK